MVSASTAVAHPDRRWYGATVMLIGVGFGAVQDAFLKQLSDSYPFHQMQFLRSLIALVLIGVWLWWHFGAQVFKGTWRPVLIVRGMLISFGSMFFYLGLVAMPLADAVAIYFALPLIVVLLSGVLLRESIQGERLLVAGLGFFGVVIAIEPSRAVFDWASMLPLIATVFYAIGHILTRKVDHALHPMMIAFYTAFCFAVVAGLLSIIFGFGTFASDLHPSLSFLTRGWEMPTWRDGMLICVLGLMSLSGFFAYAQAYRVAPPSFVASFEYSSMLWAIGLGFFFFSDVPKQSMVIGSAVIIVAGLYLGWHERRTSPR